MVPTTGSSPTVVQRPSRPRFSPDYKSIVYLSFLDGNPRIYIYDIGTGRQRLITESSNPTFAPRWSPDGKWILYSMAIAGNTDIYKVSSQGGQPQRLTFSPGIDIGGSFSPDGSRIVFESDRSGSQQLYVMSSNGGNERRISFGGGRYATPEWSPARRFDRVHQDCRQFPDWRHDARWRWRAAAHQQLAG